MLNNWLNCLFIHLAVGVTAALLPVDRVRAAEGNAGLVAEYSDGQSTVQRVVPSPNFTLAAKESVHPQVAPKFSASYTGMLKISRGGTYTITGDAQIQIDGQDVAGKPLKLAPGDHALKATYRREAGPARLQLRWKSDFFLEEPIPPTAYVRANVNAALTGKWTQIEHGRLLYENLSCGACHGAEGWNLSSRKGPDLSDIGSRVTTDWLYTWLKNPRHYRKTAVMPSLVTTNAEIQDVAAYLAQLKNSPSQPAEAPADPSRIEAGKEIFAQVGCKNCHGPTGHSLTSVGSKFRSSHALASFLADPLHVDPSGRMPQMFDPKSQLIEAETVAHFLFHTKRNAERTEFPDGGDAQRGRILVKSRGCLACHAVNEAGKPLADERESPQFTKSSKQQTKAQPGKLVRYNPQKGCLADAPIKGTPNYDLSAADRASLRALLSSLAEHPVVAMAPVETFYRRMSQFNCVACHALNGESRLPVTDVDEAGRIVPVERPPTLTAAGDKLRSSWIRRVILENKRTRPWLKTRMPHFGAEVEALPALFPAAAGSPTSEPSVPPKMELAKAGLETIGVQRGKVACIACHDYRQINQQTKGVTPAPDMAEIGETLRYDWFRRWLHDPQRITPGTSMPQFFAELTPVARERKIDELWAALFHQSRLPLPAGLLDTKTEGTRIVVGDSPVLFRAATIVPPKVRIDRAINVGLPGGTNFTFDAATARLRYAWKGEFINAAAAWNGRGGNPVSAIGQSLLASHDHFPIRVGTVSSDPEVRFLGYYFVNKHPVFRYMVDDVEVHERIDLNEKELTRRFTINAAAKPIFFVSDKQRAYSSSAGPLKDGVLTVPAGKQLAFEVHTPLTVGTGAAEPRLKWIAAKGAKAPTSKNGSNATVIFENKMNRRVKLYWVAYDGQLKLYGEIDARASRQQNTYAGNTWVITDENDKPLGHFIAKPLVSRAVIPN